MNLVSLVQFEDGRLILTTDAAPGSLDGNMVVATLTFEKVK